MALKAGRVGVHPSQVDISGHIIGGESVDAYTKSQADAKFVNKSQLKANNKNFNFAYDETSGKYGYKLNSDGEFIPFSSGSAGGLGINLTDPSIDGVSKYSGTEILEGGYQTDSTTNVTYINMKIKISGDKTQGNSLLGLYTAIQPKQIKLLLPTDKISYYEQEIRANAALNDGEEITITGIAY